MAKSLDIVVNLRFGDRPSAGAEEINKAAGKDIKTFLNDTFMNDQQKLQQIINLARKLQVSWNVAHKKKMAQNLTEEEHTRLKKPVGPDAVVTLRKSTWGVPITAEPAAKKLKDAYFEAVKLLNVAFATTMIKYRT